MLITSAPDNPSAHVESAFYRAALSAQQALDLSKCKVYYTALPPYSEQAPQRVWKVLFNPQDPPAVPKLVELNGYWDALKQALKVVDENPDQEMVHVANNVLWDGSTDQPPWINSHRKSRRRR
jgi:hypothetical protein